MTQPTLIRVRINCPECKGTGKLCWTCEDGERDYCGPGEFATHLCDQSLDCPDCHATGKIIVTGEVVS